MANRVNHRWTVRELNIIYVMYISFTRKEIAARLGVPESNLRDALRRYGICKPLKKKYKQWTEEEITFIRENYDRMKGPELAKVMGISFSTFRGVAYRYGLKKHHR